MNDAIHIKSGDAVLQRFIAFPFVLYRHDSAWVPPLMFRERQRLSVEQNRFFKHAERELFLVLRGNRVVGRVSAVLEHGARPGLVGFFECEDDLPACRELMNAAQTWLSKRGAKHVEGPINLSTFEESGVLIEGHDRRPPFMTGHNPPYYAALFEALGFTKQRDTLAYERPLFEADGSPCLPPPGLLKAAALGEAQSLVHVRPIRLEQWDEEIAQVHHVLMETFRELEGHVALSLTEFAAMARQMKSIMDARLMLVAESGGRIVAFAFVFPDVNEVLVHLNGRLLPFGFVRAWWWRRRVRTASFKLAGVLAEHRKGGMAAHLALQVSLAAQRFGYRRMEMSVVLESNTRMREFVELQGTTPYLRYRIYGKALR